MSESYKISEVARLLGVCTDTLRNWEKDGKVFPTRTLGNHRRFSNAEVARIKGLMENKALRQREEVIA